MPPVRNLIPAVSDRPKGVFVLTAWFPQARSAEDRQSSVTAGIPIRRAAPDGNQLLSERILFRLS